MNLDREIIESVGIEMEFSCFDRNTEKFKRSARNLLPGYKIIHDASCETPMETLVNIPIEIKNKKDYQLLKPMIRKTVIGGEIVSPVLHSGGEEWVESIHRLCALLKDNGETEESRRDSFHVHINVSQSIPIWALKNLLRIEGTLEAILYRLGGMGRLNRGEENNYNYCRPFLGHGPPVVNLYNDNEDVVPICVYDDMMESKTKEDFFRRFGDSIFQAERGTRYVTQRYMAINFYPILTQGSFEIRVANKTLNPEYIIAWTNLCKAIVQKAFTETDEASYENIKRPLYENREISEREFLTAMSYFGKLDPTSIEVLLNIWNNSPTPTFDNIWRWSHLRNPTTFTIDKYNKLYLPKPLTRKDKIMPAEFTDIHILQEHGNRINFGDENVVVHFQRIEAVEEELIAVDDDEINQEEEIEEINQANENNQRIKAIIDNTPETSYRDMSPEAQGAYNVFLNKLHNADTINIGVDFNGNLIWSRMDKVSFGNLAEIYNLDINRPILTDDGLVNAILYVSIENVMMGIFLISIAFHYKNASFRFRFSVGTEEFDFKYVLEQLRVVENGHQLRFKRE